MEFRRLGLGDVKRDREVVEVRYAKPFSVLMMYEDEGLVLGKEPYRDCCSLMSSTHSVLDASVPSSDWNKRQLCR